MDIARQPRNVVRRRVVIAAALLVAAVAATVALARMRPAARHVDRASIVTSQVRRGAFTSAIRASGTLVPENVRWIAAATDARVERVVLQPGTAVHPDDVIIELSDAQQMQSASDSTWQLRAAEAAYEAARAQLESDRLDREAAVAQLRAEREQAKLRADADADLEKAGLVAPITRRISQSNADELGRRVALAEQRVAVSATSQRARLATLAAEVEQARALAQLRGEQAASLRVRAGIEGVLQQISVQAGQRVTAGTNLARVAEPSRLKAEIRVAESQAKDVVVGLPATIDTRNGIVRAEVARVDPAVSNGSVLVDLRILDPLPAGARPDLSIDATIELQKIADTTFVARPVGVQEMSRGTLFRIRGNEADRITVQFGRASAEAIEVRGDIRPGDEIIVSDTTDYQSSDRLSIK